MPPSGINSSKISPKVSSAAVQIKFTIFSPLFGKKFSEEDKNLIYMIHLDSFQHVVLNYNLQNLNK